MASVKAPKSRESKVREYGESGTPIAACPVWDHEIRFLFVQAVPVEQSVDRNEPRQEITSDIHYRW